MTTDTRIFQNNSFTLSFTGDPVWQIDGQRVRPNSPEAFELIVQLYQQNSSEFLNQLYGHFSIILKDNEKDSILAASDRIGAHRLYWSKTSDHKVIISPSLEGVRAQQETTPELSPDALYCYMYFHMIPTPFSVYSNIEKLPSGQCLKYEKGNISIAPYWMPQFTEPTKPDIDRLSTNLRQVLRESVQDCLFDEDNYAAFLSGGLDSSTVVGVMSGLNEQPTHSYSIGFDAKEYDETPFARITANHYGATHHEYYMTPKDVVDIVPKIAAAYHEPFGNSSAVPTYYCAKVAAENGVKLMLAGDGGDELFAGNQRYSEQRLYNYYLALPEGFRRAIFDPVINHLPNALPLTSKAKSYIRQANIPLPDRMQVYNYLHRHDVNEIFNTDFIHRVNTSRPLEMLREQYNAPKEATDLNRMLYMDWKFTLADNDLRKVGTMCELAGVKVKYPLLSDKLMSYSTNIPSSLKLKNNKLRYFYKYALRAFLPKQTLTKSKHGFGLPFGIWMKDYAPLKELAHDSLGSLKSRGYFNPAFIDQTLDMHENVHAKYYGELVWLLMMLELWISSHTSQNRS